MSRIWQRLCLYESILRPSLFFQPELYFPNQACDRLRTAWQCDVLSFDINKQLWNRGRWREGERAAKHQGHRGKVEWGRRGDAGESETDNALEERARSQMSERLKQRRKRHRMRRREGWCLELVTQEGRGGDSWVGTVSLSADCRLTEHTGHAGRQTNRSRSLCKCKQVSNGRRNLVHSSAFVKIHNSHICKCLRDVLPEVKKVLNNHTEVSVQLDWLDCTHL